VARRENLAVAGIEAASAENGFLLVKSHLRGSEGKETKINKTRKGDSAESQGKIQKRGKKETSLILKPKHPPKKRDGKAENQGLSLSSHVKASEGVRRVWQNS